MSPQLEHLSSPGPAFYTIFKAQPLLILCISSFILYLVAVRHLRWRRYNAIHAKYQKAYEAGVLTPEQAQEIIEIGLSYDMPMLLRYSLSLALFKTYGIPSISKILKGTRELSSKEGVSKRFADTEILVSTMITCPINGKRQIYKADSEEGISNRKSSSGSKEADDPRAMIALARVNWLHAKYPIKNEDNLYTLALAIFEPERWAKRYGWRTLSPLECHALYIFWTEIGRRMGIQNLPDSESEFKLWADEYTSYAMVPAQSSHDVASYTLEEFINVLPDKFGIKSLGKAIAISLLEDVVREAMIFPSQPSYIQHSVEFILKAIGFLQLHFCLPRVSPSGPVSSVLPCFGLSTQTSSQRCPFRSGSAYHSQQNSQQFKNSDVHQLRMHPNWFQATPWYKPEPRTLWKKLTDRFTMWMGIYNQMPSKDLRSQGYRLEEMGPLKYENNGQMEVIQTAEKLLGRPINAPWR